MFEFLRLSFSNLRKRKLRSWLTMLGIIIGIAAVVSLISLGEGLQTAITGQFGSLSTDKLTIQNAGTGFGPPGSTVVRKLTSHDIDIIKKVQGVDEAVSRLIRIAKIEYKKEISFFYIANLPEDEKEQEIVYEAGLFKLESGELLETGDSGKILIGSDVATSFDKEITARDSVIIQGESFEVIGVLKPSSTFTINSAVIILEDDMRGLLNIGDESDLIIVQLQENANAEEVALRIEKALRKDRDEKSGEEDFSVQTPLQAISSVNTILNIINLIITGIAAISLIIGGIGIANTMYTSVLERKKEIGTMKAVGAKNSDILLIFVVESGLLGLLGGIIGALAGLGMAFLAAGGANAAFGGDIISVSINYTLLLGAVGFSFIIGILSGFFPARQASGMKPVEALK